MALKEVVHLFERVKSVNQIVERSYKVLDQMKTRGHSVQVKRLKLENKHLQKQVEAWKSRLIHVESIHDLKQVPTSSSTEENRPPPVHTTERTYYTVFVASQTKDGDSHLMMDEGDEIDDTQTKKPAKKKKKKADDRPIDVSRLDFRIGIIRTVSKHPNADSLYLVQIDLGEDKPRTVVSGLVKFVPLEEMQDRCVVVLCNIKPAKMRDVLSEGMVMCASTPEKVEVLIPPPGCVPGERVTFQGYSGEPDAPLTLKKKIFDQVAPDLKTDENCVATYKGIPFSVIDKGIVKASSLANVNIN